MKRHIVLASGNAGKIRELQQSLQYYDINISPQSAFDTPDIEETGLSFIENAILKARNACHYSKLPAIADDSGLEVDYLSGRPGIYSARFAGPNASDSDNNQKLLQALENVPEDKRQARFQCVLVYLRHETDPTPKIFQGTWEGRILNHPDGNDGFGYDPLFFVPTHQCTSAALPLTVKNQISHRGQAMQQLLNYLPLSD